LRKIRLNWKEEKQKGNDKQSVEDVTKEQRQIGKRMNYFAMYSHQGEKK